MGWKIKKLTTIAAFFILCLIIPTLVLADKWCGLLPGDEYVKEIHYRADKGYVYVITTKGLYHNVCSFATQGTKCRDIQALLTAAVLANKGVSLRYTGNTYNCGVHWGGGAPHVTNVITLQFLNK